jgi:hypothetical protein
VCGGHRPDRCIGFPTNRSTRGKPIRGLHRLRLLFVGYTGQVLPSKDKISAVISGLDRKWASRPLFLGAHRYRAGWRKSENPISRPLAGCIMPRTHAEANGPRTILLRILFLFFLYFFFGSWFSFIYFSFSAFFLPLFWVFFKFDQILILCILKIRANFKFGQISNLRHF